MPGTDLVEPFKPQPVETIFAAQAEFDSIRSRYEQNNRVLVGETFTEQLQYNYIRPTFWERVQILIFGVPPHQILAPRAVTEAELIVSSLESEPFAWKMDRNGKYTVEHKNGVKIWVANQDYGIKHRDDIVGHASSFSKEEKKLIWEAFQTWQTVMDAKAYTVWNQSLVKYAKARRIVIAEEARA